MKKLLLLLAPLTLGLMVGCSYDDSAILDKIAEMEKEHDEMQAQLDAQQTLLDALANNLTITAVTQTDNGYTSTFSDGTSMTNKDGEKGDKGDNGDKGEQGDSFIESIVVGEEDVTFTLADGTVIVIPLGSGGSSDGGEPSAENNKIYYTTSDNTKLFPKTDASLYGAILISNTYKDGQGILVFDDAVTMIGSSAFSYCYSLTSVTIPDSVTSIGDYAFSGCTSLTSITIPDGVTVIRWSAFNGCSSLTSITIPDSVTSIGMEAFNGCTSLKWVYCKPTTPPTGSSYMFDNNASGRKIYVPAESVEAYKAAKRWSDYADDIVGYDFENGGSDITQMVEVEAVYMIGLWSEDEGDYVTGFFICDKPWQDEGSANDSRTYGLSVWSKTAPVDDEIPHGTYKLGDTLGAFNGVEYIYTSNNGNEQCMYIDGIVVVSEGKIEATLTLENGEVHHVVYEGSLTTLGEGEIGG